MCSGIMPITLYIGVVFSLMWSLYIDRYDDFEGNANISAAIESGFTVACDKALG